MVIRSLSTSLPRETLHESWLENAPPPPCPPVRRSRKADILGLLFLAVNPMIPEMMVTRDARPEPQGAHNLAELGMLLNCVLCPKWKMGVCNKSLRNRAKRAQRGVTWLSPQTFA